MITEENKKWAIEQLRIKAEEIKAVPKKADFKVEEFARIKAYLGPWPRALESAGLKTAKNKEQKMEK